MRPNRKWKKPRWQPLNFKYAYVLSCLLIKTLFIIWVSLLENKSNSLAFAEKFVLSTFGLVAHYSHKSQWNAGPQKRIAVGIPLISCLMSSTGLLDPQYNSASTLYQFDNINLASTLHYLGTDINFNFATTAYQLDTS